MTLATCLCLASALLAVAVPAVLAQDAAPAAFDFLANTEARLSTWGAGRPAWLRLSRATFGSDSVHLNSLYWRPGNRTEHFYTRPWVPGARYGRDRPVYVLTSRRTFSGAEEFA
jgi:hypothetical protein